MRLLFTGASGFLGDNIIELLEDNFMIETLGRNENNDYCVNLALDDSFFKYSFDVVLHGASLAHRVPKSQKEEKAFFEVNYNGTINLCKALEKVGVPKSFIFVSSVAVYGKEFGELIKEESPLLGNSPYALSKIKAEFFLEQWCVKNNVKLSIIRPSLIAGKNPKGNLGKMIEGVKTGKYLSIAGGKAKKSVLMAEDIANIIPKLIEKGGVYNVCDDQHPSFRDLERLIMQQLGVRNVFRVPYVIAKLMALIGDAFGSRAPFNSSVLEKMTKSLTFSNEKAKKELNWEPLNVIDNFKIN